MQTLLGHHWHHLPAEEVVEFLDSSSEQGLEPLTIAERQAHFGPNRLGGQRSRGPLLRFLSQFHQPLIYILIAAGIVTMAFKEWTDGTLILGVVVINAIVGFLQEAKALDAIAALARGLPSEATVIRAGQKLRMAALELVPGDVVLLQSGDKVPADLRLLRSRELRVDESTLTGESVPGEKSAALLPKETSLGDRRNMAYSSTLVTYGVGTGVVVATGDRTEIGQISQLLATTDTLETPLVVRIQKLSRQLAIVILLLAAVLFSIDVWRGQPWLETFKVAVALAVGAIPEGLPAAVTIILAIGVSRMAKRHAIIRSLPAVETLGGVTVICSDKTGTLTQNQMTVQELFAASHRYVLSGTGYKPEGQLEGIDGAPAPARNVALRECLRAGALCNDAALVHRDGSFQIQGDPTEAALLVAARKGGFDLAEEQRTAPRVDAIPFESERQYMATLHETGSPPQRVVYVKGSVESLLVKCAAAMTATGAVTELDHDRIHAEVEAMARAGLRVIACACKSLPQTTATIQPHDVATDLVFLGVMGMIDPARPEAARAVATCQQAGIRVKMITGDHPVTAAAIAQQLAIGPAGAAGGLDAVVTGRELSVLHDAELLDVAQRSSVFARVSPEHKLRLVAALQARNEVVAMTGDGVNDAPALRRADIGVAMGLAGTEVAREAADMILADDNFASIEAAVEEGRAVHDTLQKFLVWTLPTNGGQALVLLLAVLIGVPLPLQPVQLLWINMSTAICLGLTLAFERAEPGSMQRPPRDPHAPFLDRHLLLRVTLVSALISLLAFGLFEWALHRGMCQSAAWTVVTNAIVFGQLFYLFNCRSLTRPMWTLGVFSNPILWLGVGLMVLLQLAFTYAPFMNRLLHSAPIDGFAWLLIAGGGAIVYTSVGLEKWFQGRRRVQRQLTGE